MKKLSFLLLGVVLTGQLSAAPGELKSLTVLPTTDTAELGLAQPLQYALGQLLQGTGSFQVQLSGYQLPGFTRSDINKTFQVIQSDLFSFVYMEKQRISVFLFDKNQPNGFIVSYRLLTDPPNNQLTSEYIESKFRETVEETLQSYSQQRFQGLPGDGGEGSENNAENKMKADEARKLFRELASIEEKKYYFGGNIGMARFSANSNSASTVNFGGYAGAKLSDRVSGEFGLDIFSYSLLHLDARYHLPFAEKYVNLSATAGIARFMGTVTENRGFQSSNIPNGQMVFGPGIGFDVPLLGATLRGDIRLYLGSATVLLGTYGIVYHL